MLLLTGVVFGALRFLDIEKIHQKIFSRVRSSQQTVT
jgi:hypothetical protein